MAKQMVLHVKKKTHSHQEGECLETEEEFVFANRKPTLIFSLSIYIYIHIYIYRERDET